MCLLLHPVTLHILLYDILRRYLTPVIRIHCYTSPWLRDARVVSGANTSDSVPIFSLYFSPSLGFCCGEIYVQERRMRVQGGLTAEGARTRIDAALAASGASLLSDTNNAACRGELYVHFMGQGAAKQKALDMARNLFPGMNKKVIKVHAYAFGC